MARHFLILALVIIFAVPILVSAAPSAGLKPTSFFYFLDITVEKISLFFTFDPFEKAKKSLLNADERIEEIQVSKDNSKALARVANEYQKNLSQAFRHFEKIENPTQKAGFIISFENRSFAHRNTILSSHDESKNGEVRSALEGAARTYLNSFDAATQAANELLSEDEPAPEEKIAGLGDVPVMKTEVELVKHEEPSQQNSISSFSASQTKKEQTQLSQLTQCLEEAMRTIEKRKIGNEIQKQKCMKENEDNPLANYFCTSYVNVDLYIKACSTDSIATLLELGKAEAGSQGISIPSNGNAFFDSSNQSVLNSSFLPKETIEGFSEKFKRERIDTQLCENSGGKWYGYTIGCQKF